MLYLIAVTKTTAPTIWDPYNILKIPRVGFSILRSRQPKLTGVSLRVKNRSTRDIEISRAYTTQTKPDPTNLKVRQPRYQWLTGITDSIAGQISALKTGGMSGGGQPRRKKRVREVDSSDDKSDTKGDAGSNTSNTDTDTDSNRE